MKLLKCHIENFGKLANFDFQFNESLNILNEENGWGKTTFATFIKSMFYGLPSTTKRNLDENERKKYLPWQGGNFGGSIEFELNGKCFKIVRFFGKNSSEDSFELIDLATGKVSKEYSENIGEEIFSLDEDAFERSAFLPQKALNSLVSESISNKLTNLIHGTNEQFNLDDALDLLDRKRALLSNNKKSGKIQILENEADELLLQINALKNSGKAILELQNQVVEIDNNIENIVCQQNQVKEEMSHFAKVQQKVANKELYQNYCDKLKEIENEIGIREDIINGHDTSIDQINDFIGRNNEIIKKQEKVHDLNNGYVVNRQKELIDYFGGENNLPHSYEFSSLQEKINEYKMLKLNCDKASNQTFQTKKGKGFIFPLIMLILSVMFVALGVATLNKVEILPIILFVGAGLSLLFAGFIYLKNQINSKSIVVQTTKEEIQQNQSKLTILEKEIKSFVSRFEVGIDFISIFNSVFEKFNELKNLQKQYEDIIQTIKKLAEEIESEKQILQEYLSKFNFGNDICKDRDKLDKLKEIYIEIANLRERYNKESLLFDRFKKDKHFEEIEDEIEYVDMTQLQKEYDILQEKIDNFKENKTIVIEKIAKIYDDMSEIDELENKREQVLTEIDMLVSEFTAIKNAMKYLKEAGDNLSSRLLAPMKNGLKKYLYMITGKDFQNIHLDTDFNISFEEYGKSREIDYLSKGYKDIVELCMRLALIETLFDKEKPFIVVDDTFVNMDEKKIENAKKFLKNISKEFQVIYFVCHRSRI